MWATVRRHDLFRSRHQINYKVEFAISVVTSAGRILHRLDGYVQSAPSAICEGKMLLEDSTPWDMNAAKRSPVTLFRLTNVETIEEKNGGPRVCWVEAYGGSRSIAIASR